MKITYRQQLLLAGQYPSFFINNLAFWAMAVAATVIADTHMSAAIACIHMPTQCSSTAFFQSIEYR
jgi:hypothetical protein